MKFNKIYETTSDSDFREVCRLFEENSIPYETLYEYRLISEKRYDNVADEGGAIIRVSPNHNLKANHILLNEGLKDQIDIEKDRFKAIFYLQNKFSKIPFLRKYSIPYQLLLLITITGGLILMISTYSNYRQWQLFDLRDKKLLVKSFTYEGETINPKTIQILTIKGVNDSESIRFHKFKQKVFLPGIESSQISANWYSNNDDSKLVIYDTDNFCDIYDGNYEIIRDFWKREIRIKSEKTEFVLLLK